jgi:hypothetical protein
MNGAVIFSNESWPGNGVFCNAQFKAPAREETMTGAMMTFGIAVGIATLICYLLMTRLRNRRVSGSYRHGFGSVVLISATAEATSSGAAMIIPQPFIRTLQATVVEATAGEAAEGTAGEAAGATNNPP